MWYNDDISQTVEGKMICTFFGHRDTPESVRPKLHAAIRQLVREGVDTFYCGGQGAFDRMVLSELRALKQEDPSIQCYEALAYLPVRARYGEEECLETILPEKIETVPKRFAISFRNRWMVEQADYVIAYVLNSVGGAAQFTDLARKKGRIVVNLAESENGRQHDIPCRHPFG